MRRDCAGRLDGVQLGEIGEGRQVVGEARSTVASVMLLLLQFFLQLAEQVGAVAPQVRIDVVLGIEEDLPVGFFPTPR